MRTCGTAAIGLALAVAVAAPAGADERVDHIARALQRSPVYVSDSASRVVSPDDVETLRADIERLPFPAYVIVAPYFPDERGFAGWDDIVPKVRDRLGRDGLYIAQDSSGISTTVQALGVRPRLSGLDLESAASHDVPSLDYRPALTVVPTVRYVLELARTGRRHPVELGAREGLPVAARLAIGGLAGLGAFGGLVLWRRPWAAPRRVTQAFEPSLEFARRVAQEALDELAAALDAAASPPDAAFDAQRAASKAMEGARHPVDWIGAAALALGGQAAVRGESARACFFNPLHGPAGRSTRWQRGEEALTIPACRACARALRRGRPPKALLDRGRPYWERDTVWARTGFGTVDSGLAERVLRGEGAKA